MAPEMLKKHFIVYISMNDLIRLIVWYEFITKTLLLTLMSKMSIKPTRTHTMREHIDKNKQQRKITQLMWKVWLRRA